MAKRGFNVFLLLVGVVMLAAPDLYSFYVQRQTQAAISAFQSTVSQNAVAEHGDNPKKQYQEYNQKLFSDYLNDSFAREDFTYNPFPDAFEEGLFGYISIPAMDVELPLYLGSTEENMAKGAVVLGGTSLPIGGSNTNSVIAGHRGYRGAPYFRDIELLQVGDSVYVTNPWETLTYTVSGITVIDPYDFAATAIQPEKDMITLYTCHPYRSHGKCRYLVYCENTTVVQGESEAIQSTVQRNEQITVTTPMEFQSSMNDIFMENAVRKGALCVSLLILLFIVQRDIKSKKQ